VHTPSAGGVLSSSSHDGTGNFSPKGTLTLSQHNGAVVRWERNAGNGWQIIPHTPNQPTYSYLNLRSSASYRAIVQNGTCSEAPSAEVKIEVISLPYSASSSLQALPGTNYQWYKGDILVTGATGQILPISESGVYTVKETSVNPHRTTGVFYVYPPAFRQVQRVNAFSSVSILKAGVTETTSLYTLQPHELAQQVAYKDGLGKVFQIVDVGGSPQQTDIVLPSGVGRQGLIDTTYLPYVSANRDGRYRPYGIKGSNNAYTSSEQYQFYQNTPKVAQDNYPFARTLYRNTPDAKVTEQGAPGADWQPGSGRTVRNVLALNTATGDYAVKYWKPDGTTTGNYPANSVVVSITTDENGNKVHTYTNALGQTVLKQVQEGNNSWLETYYIYDEFGRLKYQVPPKALEALGSGTDVKVTALAELIYTYTYDARHRLVEKKVPGAAVQYLVYDKLDRVVLTQDGNLRNSSNWIFVKYDRYNRIAYTGIYKNTAQTTRTAVQALVDQENYSTTPWYETEGTTVHGYTNLAWPTAGTVANTILSVNYYDHYDFDRNGTADYSFVTNHLTGQETTASAKTRGLPTGSKRVVLDATGNPTATWLIGIVFYDQYDRPIQTRSNNHLYTTVADIATVIYDFSGKTVKSKTTHYQNATTSVSFTDRNEYDHAGRVLKTFRQINSNPEQLLAQYEYNALGQVVDKKLHDSGGGNFLQSVDLRYTIRGWLRSINNSQLTSDGLLNDDANDYFGMEVLYNSVETGLANTPYYNGNISAIKWKGPGTSGAADQRSYKYSYDKTDRLTAATFQAYTGTATNGTWTKETGTLNETITYDKNGNITALSRYQNLRGLSGTAVTATPQVMDQLTYTYGANSNQLVKVDDAATVTTGFVNGANNTTEYSYTADGSLAKDDNKGIQSITYNFLGKPQVILYTDGRKVEYVYDAAGTKLTMKTWQGTTLLACTNYSGSFVYEGATPQLSFFGSPEGRVVKNGSNFEYQYALADHQGNTRVLFSAATPAPQAVTANMEASANSNFLNYTNRISFNLFDHTDAGTTYTYAQKLTGGHNSQVGVAKSYKVYPGDKVKIEAWAKYQNPSGTGSNLANFAGALLSAFGLAPPAGGETGTPSAALNTWGSLVAGGNGGNSTGPKAFVNIIVFDKNYKLLDFAWDAIDPSAHQVGASPVVPHDYMSLEYVAKEEGYAYLYVSNENPTLVDVYFDDVVMTHTKSNVIQYNEYYPFGLQTANSWTREGAVDNKFLYNGGTELNSTTQLYDLFYRNYDPVLGRMNQVDPVFEHIEDIRRRLVSNEQ
jgi:RHS repeat-associated protein